MHVDKKTARLTRRGFAAVVVAPGAAAPAILAQQGPHPATPPPPAPNPNTTQQRRGPLPEIPPFQEPLVFTKKEAPAKVEPFPMTQVRILGGAYKDAQDWNLGYMNRLPADRLLHNFRLNAGLSSTADPFGGWEEPKGELRGHFTGHYLSAFGLASASTGDQDVNANDD